MAEHKDESKLKQKVKETVEEVSHEMNVAAENFENDVNRMWNELVAGVTDSLKTAHDNAKKDFEDLRTHDYSKSDDKIMKIYQQMFTEMDTAYINARTEVDRLKAYGHEDTDDKRKAKLKELIRGVSDSLEQAYQNAKKEFKEYDEASHADPAHKPEITKIASESLDRTYEKARLEIARLQQK